MTIELDAPRDLPPPLQRAKPLHQARLAPPFDDYLGPLPDVAASVPSMMSENERRFLFNVAKNYYSGAGLIIDAGTFLGASTACFGNGVSQNPKLEEIRARWQRPIISLELGITNQQMLLSFKRHGIGHDLTAGDSFGPLIEAHIRNVRDLVDLRLGDILETGRVEDPAPNRKLPVEILFLDVLKAPAISEFAAYEYLPRLIPRRSLVIQQDYLSGDLPFIHIHQEYFASKFEYVGEMASSAVFRLVHRITRAEVAALFENPPDGEAQIALVSRAVHRSIDPYRRLIMSFAKLRAILNARGLDAAKEYLAFVESEYADQIAQQQLRRVQNVVRAARYLCQVGAGAANEREAVKISTGHRGADHRRTDVVPSEEKVSA
jgi:hypothetical protein